MNALTKLATEFDYESIQLLLQVEFQIDFLGTGWRHYVTKIKYIIEL